MKYSKIVDTDSMVQIRIIKQIQINKANGSYYKNKK